MAALAEFKSHPDFTQLASAFKRVGNIVKGGVPGEVNRGYFREPIETELYERVEAVGKTSREKLGAGKYLEALTEISTLREPVDRFFDDVMVMAEDESLRMNRLALLTSISRLFNNIADFSKVST